MTNTPLLCETSDISGLFYYSRTGLAWRIYSRRAFWKIFGHDSNKKCSTNTLRHTHFWKKQIRKQLFSLICISVIMLSYSTPKCWFLLPKFIWQLPMRYNLSLETAAVDHNLCMVYLLILNLSCIFMKASFLALSLATFNFLSQNGWKCFYVIHITSHIISGR